MSAASATAAVRPPAFTRPIPVLQLGQGWEGGGASGGARGGGLTTLYLGRRSCSQAYHRHLTLLRLNFSSNPSIHSLPSGSQISSTHWRHGSGC